MINKHMRALWSSKIVASQNSLRIFLDFFHILVNSGIDIGSPVMVMAKGDGREVGFQDGGYFSKFLKR